MRSNMLLIVTATLIISVIVTLNQFFLFNYRAEMAQQFNTQQLLLAENISGSIKRRLDHTMAMSLSFARLLGDTSLDRPDIARFVDDAFAEDDDIIRDLKIFGTKNDLKFGYSKEPITPKETELLKIAGKTDKEKLLMKTLGNDLFLVAPISDGSLRKGTLIIDISISYITEKFLAPVKSGSKGYAWMMDHAGTLLYHPTQRQMLGKNLFKADSSCFKCHKSFEAEKRIIESGATGVKTYIAPFGEDKIIAFSRVDISPDSFWVVCVSIPFTEVTASITTSVKLHTVLVITIFIATVFAAFIMVVINRKRIKAEERAKHEAELERYAAELEKAVEKRTLELISEKEKLFAIVEALDVGLFLADHDMKIIWVNKTLQDWLGDEKAVKGLKLEDIYGGTEISSIVDNRMIQEVVKHRIGRKKGYFQITSSPLVGPDGTMQLLGLIHDITELKEFETQMAHSERLAALGSLTAGIAHEIGNPLTSVFSFLQILREMEKDKFKQDSLETILFHINRIAEIVKQMSGLSKLPPAELKEIQINDLIDSAVGLLHYDRRAKSISVKKQLSPLPTVVTDGNQLSQVLMNLVLNAVDAMPEGGVLTVRSGENEENVLIEVEDSGAGIPPENIQKVFNPFFTTKDKGTGLGLSVSYNILKSLGGEISLKSEVGKGTTFKVRVPKGRPGA